MAFWLDIAAFAVKALLIVAAIGGVVAIVTILARNARGGPPDDDPPLKVRSLDDRYDAMRDTVDFGVLDKKGRKALAKARKREAKAEAKVSAGHPAAKRVYVLSFKGDIAASSVRRLGAEIDAVLMAARPSLDEVVLRIESPGGTVTGYGLAAAQIMRLRERQIKVTAAIDQVAASGGYLMASAADRIVAAPFALIGSIGVVAQVPNLHRLLKKNDIDYEELTAGEHKRSVSVLGEISPAGREHLRGKLDTTHEAFKAFVKRGRPALDIDKVGDGDVWLASQALDLGLVDALSTSDALLYGLRGAAKLFELSLGERKSPLRQLLDRFGFVARSVLDPILRISMNGR